MNARGKLNSWGEVSLGRAGFRPAFVESWPTEIGGRNPGNRAGKAMDKLMGKLMGNHGKVRVLAVGREARGPGTTIARQVLVRCISGIIGVECPREGRNEVAGQANLIFFVA